MMFGFSSGKFEEKTGGNNPVTTTSVGGGVYAQEMLGPVDLRGAVLLSRVNFASHRDIEFSDNYFYDLSGNWEGWTSSASVSASSRIYAGRFFANPKASLDWFSLSQDGYTETGGDGLLEAEVSSVDTDRLSASGVLGLGADFNFTDGLVRLEAEAGYRSIASSTPYSADVSFLGSEDSFVLSAPDSGDDAALLGFSLSGGNDRANFNFGYSAELGDDTTTHYAGGSVRIRF